MYTVFKYTNNDSEVVDFLMDITTSGYICLTDVNFELVSAGVDRDRMERNASWPTFTYYKRMLIHMECDISADTPDHFHTFWSGTLQKLMVDATVVQTQRSQGTLTIRPSGVTEDWTMGVVLDSPPGMPRGGMSPSAGRATLTFKGFTPYFHRVTTGDSIWHV